MLDPRASPAPGATPTSLAEPGRSPKPTKSAPNLLWRFSSSAVAPEAVEEERSSRGNTLQQKVAAVKQTAVHFTQPSKSGDGGVSYGEDELETLDVAESCCPPIAADSPLAVSNCHMLQFLAQQGGQCARNDSTLGLVRQPSAKSSSTEAGPGALSRALKSQLSSRFADIVAKANERHKEGAESPLQTPTPTVSVPHHKGSSSIEIPDCFCSRLKHNIVRSLVVPCC